MALFQKHWQKGFVPFPKKGNEKIIGISKNGKLVEENDGSYSEIIYEKANGKLINKNLVMPSIWVARNKSSRHHAAQTEGITKSLWRLGKQGKDQKSKIG